LFGRSLKKILQQFQPETKAVAVHAREAPDEISEEKEKSERMILESTHAKNEPNKRSVPEKVDSQEEEEDPLGLTEDEEAQYAKMEADFFST
jgi:hypothetical protein